MGYSVWKSGDRTRLYSELVARYGEFNSTHWNASRPINVTKEEYRNFLETIANDVGASSADAVQNQIQWAVTEQLNVGSEHVRTWVLNKAAAYEAGFITRSLMPRELSITL